MCGVVVMGCGSFAVLVLVMDGVDGGGWKAWDGMEEGCVAGYGGLDETVWRDGCLGGLGWSANDLLIVGIGGRRF